MTSTASTGENLRDDAVATLVAVLAEVIHGSGQLGQVRASKVAIFLSLARLGQ